MFLSLSKNMHYTIYVYIAFCLYKLYSIVSMVRRQIIKGGEGVSERFYYDNYGKMI